MEPSDTDSAANTCENVHLATGSSAGTVKDTWVSARINSFTILWAERYTGHGMLLPGFNSLSTLFLSVSFYPFLCLSLSTYGLRSVTEFKSCKELLQIVKLCSRLRSVALYDRENFLESD